MSSSLYDGPIIDAHHHLWELDSGRYTWLTDGPREVVFGSTAPLIRDYFLADYLADMAGIGLVKSVHIQASFFEDPVVETRWLQGIAATTAAAYVLYTLFSPATFGSPKLLATAPFVVFGLLRYLRIVRVPGKGESPEALLFRDPWLLTSVALWSVTVLVLLYLV